MGSLRDQFEKAKLLSKKDQKRLAHEERVERKEKGREVLEQERAAREAELAQLREEERRQDRERQQALEQERRVQEERAACEAILATEVRQPSRGPVGFLFELPDGRLPVLRITDVERHQLAGGHLAIVRTKPGDAHVYGLLAASHAQRVARSLPDRVVWTVSAAVGA